MQFKRTVVIPYREGAKKYGYGNDGRLYEILDHEGCTSYRIGEVVAKMVMDYYEICNVCHYFALEADKKFAEECGKDSYERLHVAFFWHDAYGRGYAVWDPQEREKVEHLQYRCRTHGTSLKDLEHAEQFCRCYTI